MAAEVQVKGFSFKKAKETAKELTEPKIFALICGIRGQGKSAAIGTLNMPMWLITSSMESHSIASAQIYGGDNVTPIFYDIDDDKKQMRADAAIIRLHNILDFLIHSDDTLDNIQAVALDSMSAVDKTLLETTKVSQANGFDAPKIMEQEHLRIIKKLKELHRKGLHIIATLPILGTFDENNLYISAKPELRGTSTTSNIAGNFDDILVVTKQGEDYAFQMDLLLKKTGKEITGADKHVVFSPRITGLSAQDLVLTVRNLYQTPENQNTPELLLPANLNYVYQLKLDKYNYINTIKKAS